jgi:hypothetical protein
MSLRFVALPLLLVALGATEATAEPRLAVMPFDYVDTSGEPTDQSADHERRMGLFRETLQGALGAEGKVDAVELPCTQSGCTPANSRPLDLLDSARSVSANFIVLGAVQKMSTLISTGWVNVIDVGSGQLALARKLSFRGDNDEAFRRAAGFAADDIVRNLPAVAASGEAK